MSRTRKAPQTWEEQIDLVAKHGHEVDQRSVDQRAKVIARLNSNCVVCGAQNPGIVSDGDHGMKWGSKGRIKGWKAVTSKGRGGLVMVCGDECAHHLNFEAQVLTGKKLMRAEIR